MDIFNHSSITADASDAALIGLTSIIATVIGVLLFLWRLVQPKLDIAWTILYGIIACAIGAILWAVALGLLKQWGWEPESTNAFGGADEARLAGGMAVGLVYFFALAAVVTFVDIKIYGDSTKRALLANIALLLGTTAGASLFYGLRVRELISTHGWSHLMQESVLVLIWSGLIVGLGLALYSIMTARLLGTSLLRAVGKATACTLLPMLLCYLTVYLVVRLGATSEHPREEARGILVGLVVMCSILLAHELLRARPTKDQASQVPHG